MVLVKYHLIKFYINILETKPHRQSMAGAFPDFQLILTNDEY